jgi:CheY-like chemotaxis protein
MREAGYSVTATADFQEAKRLLDAHGPDLLIADVRLGPFNGLHLVIRTHFRYPIFRAILLDVKHDRVLERDALRYGSSYVVNPTPSELLATAGQILAEEPVPRRRWERKELRGGMAARIGDVDGTVVNVSYGGLCFQASISRGGLISPVDKEELVPTSFDVSFPQANLSVPAKRMWISHLASLDAIRCGVAVQDSEAPSWQSFVNQV